jgi:hypothetical protein
MPQFQDWTLRVGQVFPHRKPGRANEITLPAFGPWQIQPAQLLAQLQMAYSTLASQMKAA